MTRTGLKYLIVALGMASLCIGGCAEDQKKRIFELENSYNRLVEDTNKLQGELAQAKSDNKDLTEQLAGKDDQLAAKDRTIRDLRDELTRKGSEPPPPRPEPEEGTRITVATVGSDVLFTSGRATLTPKGEAALRGVATELKTKYGKMLVRVYGYTDSDPIRKSKHLWKDNLDLSANRAMAVTRYLISVGIDPQRIETIAMGEANPVAPNTTREGKQRNRRVEIVAVSR
jgi:flagellar motor protein MotB